MDKGWYIIANVFSNSGKTKKSLPEIKKLLETEAIDYEMFYTRFKGDEIKMVESATKLGYTKIIGIGGDGTAQKIVAGIMIQKKHFC